MPTAPALDAAVPRVRPGQLTLPWLVTTAALWALVFLAMTGVWKASQELGLATWWLGPFSDPNGLTVRLTPFLAPTAMLIAALANLPWLPLGGVLAGLATAGIGLFDLGSVPRLGVVELAVGAAATAFSLASLSGMYRRPT